jgi:hypothetical protein
MVDLVVEVDQDVDQELLVEQVIVLQQVPLKEIMVDQEQPLLVMLAVVVEAQELLVKEDKALQKVVMVE